MPYDAVSAYTVLLGDGDGPPSVTVHGSADDAWRALGSALGHSGGPDAVHEAAERWRRHDPHRRFWHVSPHRLRVTVPAIGA